MESLQVLSIKRDELNRLISLHKGLDKVFKESIQEEGNVRYIKEDAELTGNYLLLRFPIANKEWSEDLLRIALRLGDFGGYISVDNEDKAGTLRVDIASCIESLCEKRRH